MVHLRMNASGIASGGLRVQVMTFDEHDLRAAPREEIGEGAARNASADDENLGVHAIPPSDGNLEWTLIDLCARITVVRSAAQIHHGAG